MKLRVAAASSSAGIPAPATGPKGHRVATHHWDLGIHTHLPVKGTLTDPDPILTRSASLSYLEGFDQRPLAHRVFRDGGHQSHNNFPKMNFPSFDGD